MEQRRKPFQLLSLIAMVGLLTNVSAMVNSDTMMPECLGYLNMPGGDLPNMPVGTANSSDCRSLCSGNSDCALFTFVEPASGVCSGKFANGRGCCWLKTTEVEGSAPTVFDQYACSAWVRTPNPSSAAVPTTAPATATATATKKGVFGAVPTPPCDESECGNISCFCSNTTDCCKGLTCYGAVPHDQYGKCDNHDDCVKESGVCFDAYTGNSFRCCAGLTCNRDSDPRDDGICQKNIGSETPTKEKASLRDQDSRPNVLYVLVDDLRPELEAYGQNFTHNPNIAALAKEGIVFDNAYCQIAVCSPSRLSFLSGRRPDHAGITNFINHFRQSDCGLEKANVMWSATPYFIRSTKNFGNSGQCCSLCSQDPKCTHWTQAPQGNCSLMSETGSAVSTPGFVSGVTGSATPKSHQIWTSNPENFKKNGYLALSSGKIFHTEEGGVGNINPDLNGPGMPPNEDPPSWTEGLSMQNVNAVAQMWPISREEEAKGVPASLDGIFDQTTGDLSQLKQLADRVVSQDSIAKLRYAAYNRNATGQPFFMGAGFRKPHLAFRFPTPWLEKLLPENQTAVATHPTLDPSVPSIAHGDHDPQVSPFIAVDKSIAQHWRCHYYAAVAWVDSQIGKVLDELDVLGQKDNTLVVLHSDHGWSLGEHGEYQKFSNFEHGTRVPLIIRAPWIKGAVGRSSVLAELIDIYPTMADLAGIALPNEKLDGKSLGPVVRDVMNQPLAQELKPYAMSQYMRCPKNESIPWSQNACLFVERVLTSHMGYTIRTAEYRFTEWTRWNGSSLTPDHTSEGLVGVELYSHRQVGIDYDFNEFENVNEAQDKPEIVAQLRTLLHEAIRNQTRIPSLTPKF